MPRYLVKYDYWDYTEVVAGQDPETGDAIIEDQEESGDDSIEVEADNEIDAREQAADALYYEHDDVDIYSVHSLDEED